MEANDVKSELKKFFDSEKAKHSTRFFKTGPGEYGEGDRFWGITVPEQRKIAKKFKDLDLLEVQILLDSQIHEHRLTALLILVCKFPKLSDPKKKEVYEFYLRNTHRINNWDLVDSSAHYIVGGYILENPEKSEILYKLAKSDDLWEKRIAMIANWILIRENKLDHVLEIAEILVNDDHDLIHKAVGWMIRELAKKDQNFAEKFLQKHYKTMPRTMLRYAIERFNKGKKDFYMGRSG